MSVNHNEVEVTDLEKNQSNKILITNTSEKLKFGNINTILPYLINLPTESEAQTSTNIHEDQKTVNQLKLSNWWKWIKSLLLKWYYTITTLTKTATAPALIISDVTSVPTLQNNTIERDSNGML
ncbi:hypothetical protein OIU80_05630 [Flavobacterium sp. LS1R47]|uniref:Uncharacterized protein n=1 Tax=Flavobacterium frigoritolerans TaxID=2987686 RepID=A0A9X2ZNA6_9FLAO|nr:hypothetical protein [Flavobacterium frigoritolerans]MCV9931757.1 hypothetical protein [Flavobacterium frigoritolerans]